MEARILYTNGARAVELIWVRHTGADVYCGLPGTGVKRTYHASGKVHTKQNGEEAGGGWVAPLGEIRGQFHLITTALTNTRVWSDSLYQNIPFTRGKVDAVLHIDARSIPENQLINVAVGLLEPNNLPALQSLVSAIRNVKQVLLATGTVPWVYCMLIWPVSM